MPNYTLLTADYRLKVIICTGMGFLLPTGYTTGYQVQYDNTSTIHYRNV